MNVLWYKVMEFTEGAAINESWRRTFVMSACVVQSVNTLFPSSWVPSALHISGCLWWWHAVHTGISRVCTSALSHCDAWCLEKSNWSHLIYWHHKNLNLHTCNLPLTDYPQLHPTPVHAETRIVKTHSSLVFLTMPGHLCMDRHFYTLLMIIYLYMCVNSLESWAHRKQHPPVLHRMSR